VAVYATEPDWRLVFASGEPIAYLPATHRSIIDSSVVLTDGTLEHLASTGGVLATLFSAERVA
jgi:hypothetical protein